VTIALSSALCHHRPFAQGCREPLGNARLGLFVNGFSVP